MVLNDDKRDNVDDKDHFSYLTMTKKVGVGVSITRSKEWPGDKSTLSLSLQETHGTPATDPPLMQTSQSGCLLLSFSLQETYIWTILLQTSPEPPLIVYLNFCWRKQLFL